MLNIKKYGQDCAYLSVACNAMERLYTIFVLPLSPLVALLFDIAIRKKLSGRAILLLVLACCLIASPLLLTDYNYGDFYSYWIVIAIIAAILVFIALRNQKVVTKIIIVVSVLIAAIVPTGLTLFARGFVGEDKIYDTQQKDNYKIVYKREADPVLNGSEKVELYKTVLFGLLQEYRGMQYVDYDKNRCIVTLHDKKNSTIINYDHCQNIMTIK